MADIYRKVLLDTARQFKFAADLCINTFMKPELITSKRPHMYPFSPAVVNLVFSAELLFKYILDCQGNYRTSHNLFKLYDELKQSTKDELKKLIDKSILIFSLEDEIKIHSENYDNWRYVFQKKMTWSNSYPFMNNLIEALETIIEKEYSQK